MTRGSQSQSGAREFNTATVLSVVHGGTLLAPGQPFIPAFADVKALVAFLLGSDPAALTDNQTLFAYSRCGEVLRRQPQLDWVNHTSLPPIDRPWNREQRASWLADMIARFGATVQVRRPTASSPR